MDNKRETAFLADRT